ncbi:MAG: PDZ domain-containing protein, partial [Planctomycetota bacterium]
PVLFAIIADFHADYHTPRDVSSLINRVDAVHAANLFYEIALSAAQRPEAFPFVDRREANRRRRAERNREGVSSDAEVEGVVREQITNTSTPRASSRVRFGVRPNYEDEDAGVLVEAVTPESAAARAGVLKNDRLLTWNGEEIADARAFGALLRGAKPGDKVKVGIRRAAETVTIEVTLEARGNDD